MACNEAKAIQAGAGPSLPAVHTSTPRRTSPHVVAAQPIGVQHSTPCRNLSSCSTFAASLPGPSVGCELVREALRAEGQQRLLLGAHQKRTSRIHDNTYKPMYRRAWWCCGRACTRRWVAESVARPSTPAHIPTGAYLPEETVNNSTNCDIGENLSVFTRPCCLYVLQHQPRR